ncbi:hypothetical protein NC797_14920 [Aquibacillus sp. 3ASR75-11]|uniref:Uncharacterized protein n=1 Tax=Terrihalobacillus insolitus TaxID=2950438 RepID=A0A9X4APQ1_9BACI|nr:hypothetical protein [Terrihalobacillus insolitus]MDC3414322.1 hypothetical protein [Terrihalobacillus insolitus]MDC3425798.1 hypothetical protein [Terrihalobacillus insolitus]
MLFGKTQLGRFVLCVIIVLFILSGCTKDNANTSDDSLSEIGNPTPEEILEDNSDADIFQYKEIVYTNAKDRAEEFNLTLGNRVKEIRKEYSGSDFKADMATKLPVGTEIYEPKEKQGAVLVAIIKGKKVPYIGLIEG